MSHATDRGFRRGLAVPALAVVVLAAGFGAPSRAAELKSYKDALFAYPRLLQSGDGGAYRVVDYQEMRDINQRDDIPERRVKSSYVSLRVNRMQSERTAGTRLGGLRHFAVGQLKGARYITLYAHGQGGNRKQGANDRTFGGNFNRIKNLMAANGGLYLSPDVPGFDAESAGAVADLLSAYLDASPQARLFVACGSAGGAVCYALADDPKIAARLSGMLFLGSFQDAGFLSSAAVARRVPVYFGHGSRDTVFAIADQEAFFRRLRALNGYPAQFVRFETGTHGTPIRMVDWRETLNWMLANPPG